MTDDERLLEIATRLLGKGSLVIIDQEIVLAFDAAERILKTWRERTGAQGREQDVSEEMLDSMIHALGCGLPVCGVCADLDERIVEIQRARAAGKGEGC